MRASTRIILGLAIAMLGSALFATFMIVFDELYALALYCGIGCKYPFPWTQPLGLWDAWVQTFTWIVFGVILMNVGVALVVSGVMNLRRLEHDSR